MKDRRTATRVLAVLWTGAAGLLIFFGVQVAGLSWDQFSAVGNGIRGEVTVQECTDNGYDPGWECTRSFEPAGHEVTMFSLHRHERAERVPATISGPYSPTAYEPGWFSWVVPIVDLLLAAFLWALALGMLYPVVFVLIHRRQRSRLP